MPHRVALREIHHVKSVLDFADHNILIDQTMLDDFRAFSGAMTKLSVNATLICA